MLTKSPKKSWNVGLVTAYYGAAGGGGYQALGINLPGTGTQSLNTASVTPFTGATAGQKGCCSFWFGMRGLDSNYQVLIENASQFRGFALQRQNNNKWSVILNDSGGGPQGNMDSSSTYLAGSGWHHFCACWDQSVGNTASRMFIDDVDATPGVSGSSGTIDYAAPFAENILCRSGGSLPCFMDLADLYINWSDYLDISNTTSRRKFISASGHPVDLGINGSTPTGNQPIALFTANNTYSGQTIANWGTNRGSGGTVTLTGSALAASSTNP